MTKKSLLGDSKKRNANMKVKVNKKWVLLSDDALDDIDSPTPLFTAHQEQTETRPKTGQ